MKGHLPLPPSHLVDWGLNSEFVLGPGVWQAVNSILEVCCHPADSGTFALSLLKQREGVNIKLIEPGIDISLIISKNNVHQKIYNCSLHIYK